MGMQFILSMLVRFERKGRGTGTYEEYIPWHRVSRSDPSSRGRSHLLKWNQRQRELLSDLEQVAFLFGTMHPDVIDIREQFPLSTEFGFHELNKYRGGHSVEYLPGTIEICKEIGVKHPMLNGKKGERGHWVMTTDILMTLKNVAGVLSLLAVSVKPVPPRKGSRSWKLLNIEREYWNKRGVRWLLITTQEYDPVVADALKCTFSWALGQPFDQAVLDWLIDQKHRLDGRSLTSILRYAAAEGKEREDTKIALWHGIWTGQLTFDLRRGWRPSDPFILLSSDEFWDRNPIVSGRTAWNP